MSEDTTDARRALPAMDRLLQEPMLVELISTYGRDQVRLRVERRLSELRQRLAADGGLSPEAIATAVQTLPAAIEGDLQRQFGPPVQRVLNATGIFVHTNLGRSPLPRAVAAELAALLDAYCDVELDLQSGRRHDRNRRVEALLKALTGCPAAVVVNNNAAALVLALATLARDREVVVSRGELVEIGGSFRIPSILEAAGARLVEVGTTNRTCLADYEAAIGPSTGLVLKVFPSNYRLSGFVASVGAAALVELCRDRSLPLLVDEGSGLLRPHSAPQFDDHRSLSELMDLDCPLACGSGDKLLGGPQAGLLVGDESLVRECRRHPLYRALRPDRACLCALEQVLRLHLVGGALPLDGLWPSTDEHRCRLERFVAALGGEIVVAEAFIGGGAAPERPISGEAVALPENDELMKRLRGGQPAVIVAQRHGRMMVDLRTVDPADDEALIGAFETARRKMTVDG